MGRILLVAALAGAASLANAQAKASEINFTELRESFVEARCSDGTREDMDGVLGAHYVKADLGAFEIHYPTEFLDEKKRPEDLIEVLVGLADLQRVWVEWLTAGGESESPALAELGILREWFSDVKPKDLKALGKKGGAFELFAALEASDEVRAAQQSLRARFHNESEFGVSLTVHPVVRMVLCPTRRDFIEWVAFIGHGSLEKRNELFVDGVDQWTQFWKDWTILVAMEYAPWSGFDPNFRTGKSMRSIEKTGLVEQVSLQAAMALQRMTTNRSLGHHDNALAANLVIGFVGQINTIDGEGQIGMSGNTTQPYERFVPGGNPNGGTLPMKSAAAGNMVVKSQWRKDNGADYFWKALRKGQKDGAKSAPKSKEKDDSRHFLLKATGKYVVSAPFLGTHAAEQPYPPFEFLNEYGEFFRAYKSGFYEWLRTRGVGSDSPEESGLRFRDLLRRVDDVGPNEKIEDLFVQVYGVPLSGPDGSVDCLEWRFLRFLKKGK